MILENNPSARMQVRSRGELVAPACCCVCGNATCDDGYIDLGVYIDFHGTVYLCMTCAVQAGETVGLFTPAEVNHFQMQIEGLLKANETLTLELESAQSYISNFDSLLRAAFPNGTLPSGSSPEGVLETPERADSREPEPEESVKIKKSSGVGGAKLHNITFE